MQKKNAVKWLYGELPDLVEKKVLSHKDAENIKAYYGEVKIAGNTLLSVIIGIIGCLLVGGGMILIFAHNWDQLSRTVKTGLAFAPLLLSTGFCLWVLMGREKAMAFREGAAILQSLSVCASISLVAQIYHISGDFPAFLLTWMLLTLPMAYIMNSSSAALIYTTGITWRMGILESFPAQNLLYYPLLSLIIPHIIFALKRDRFSNRSSLLLWGNITAITTGTAIIMDHYLPGMWIIILSGIMASLYLAGDLWFQYARSLLKNPLGTFGSTGIFILSAMFTYEWPWKYTRMLQEPGIYFGNYDSADLIMLSGCALLFVFLFVKAAGKKGMGSLIFAVCPIIAFPMHMAVASGFPRGAAQAVFNIYILLLGVLTLVKGIRTKAIGKVNSGMGMVTILIMLRFFDSSMGILTRGIVFTVLGIGFLSVNLIMTRKFRSREA